MAFIGVDVNHQIRGRIFNIRDNVVEGQRLAISPSLVVVIGILGDVYLVNIVAVVKGVVPVFQGLLQGQVGLVFQGCTPTT